ncbi:MAG: hypothetical protein GX071_10575 [Gammaproteobacteria bacterium]|nr:hypothetical protein [Gammaproteobacteria bacterium]
MATFEVVFQGQVRPGVEIAQARARIGQLFQVDDRQLDILFSGRRIVIKQGLDDAAAEKYRQAIERAGALCEVQPTGSEQAGAAAEPPAAPSAPQPEPAIAQRASSGPEPRDGYMAAFADVQAPDLPLAPLGADMQDSYADYTPLDIDLSAFSLAPVGADLEQLPNPPPPPAPDTSHLKVADED